ncbi:hypothetical protein Ngar_c27800 [Candidatus Nitrososphaera gargensis Ga9.2]|uniref:DUF8156 domain-containing protein n=1 Tax=Nitrososphaera gargensis (strain Ga9.2) TaxID=1237085 RepID=K0IEE4_NITGG|nr:hypothetical protein Ngar_c27800 [Candidatus Nitrososphaera gargensis Ga9.2]
MALMEEESEWKGFRKCLERKERKILDGMFDKSRLYIPSCMYSANPIVIYPIFLSMLLHHYRELSEIVNRVEQLTGERYDTIPK